MGYTIAGACPDVVIVIFYHAVDHLVQQSVLTRKQIRFSLSIRLF